MRELLKEKNFSKLFLAVLFSELGGYLTNTVILFYINEVTNGSRLYLGLSQVLFVAPLLLGTLVGGSLGERSDKRRLMMMCEVSNFCLIIMMFFTESVVSVIAIRAVIVFFAGLYNPNRMAIMQEIVDPRQIRKVNGAFTAIFAFMHSVGPWLGAVAYKTFGGIEEVLVFNLITYLLGASLIFLIRYRPALTTTIAGSALLSPKRIVSDVRDGLKYIGSRDDLSALLQSVAVGGICLGVFFPTLLPFIREVFSADEAVYGQLMLAFGLGGVIGGIVSPLLLKRFAKGRVLVTLSVVQAAILAVWTQVSLLALSTTLLFFWGVGLMCLISTYINYVQVNVSAVYRTRAFSIYDQSISLNVIIGAALTAAIGDRLLPSQLLALTAFGALGYLIARTLSARSKALYAMES